MSDEKSNSPNDLKNSDDEVGKSPLSKSVKARATSIDENTQTSPPVPAKQNYKTLRTASPGGGGGTNNIMANLPSEFRQSLQSSLSKTSIQAIGQQNSIQLPPKVPLPYVHKTHSTPEPGDRNSSVTTPLDTTLATEIFRNKRMTVSTTKVTEEANNNNNNNFQPNSTDSSDVKWPEVAPFGLVDDPSRIIFDEEGKIKAATPEKLVEYATRPQPDPHLLKALLLTYRSIITPKELLELLKQRFNQQLPEGDVAVLKAFQSQHQRPMQIRVLQLLKTWSNKHFYDFEEDEELVNSFCEFLTNNIAPVISGASALETSVKSRLESSKIKNIQYSYTSPPPKSILPIKPNPTLLDCHPLEIARQLTLIEADLYRKIVPRECMGLQWSKKDGKQKAGNVLGMIDYFNKVSSWVVSEIVRGETQKARVDAFIFFIKIANKLKELNNFNGCMEILSGLGDASVFRLKNHWTEIPKKYINTYNDLKAIMSSDKAFLTYRNFLRTVTPPVIPYLGIYLTDLTFIEDGNPDKIGNLPNFFKRRLVSNIIEEIQQHQQTPYCVAPVKEIQNLLRGLDQRCLDKETCYQRSLAILPRGGVATTGATPPLTQSSGAPSGPPPKPKEVQEEFEEIPGYLFNEKDSPNNILLSANANDQQLLAAGTLEKIIERLTYPKYPDPILLDSFLLSFRSFATSKRVLELLAMRYNIPKPKNPAHMEKFQKDILLPTQIRVVNVLKNWTSTYPSDFLTDKELSKSLNAFIESNSSDMLIKTLKKNVGKTTDRRIPVSRTKAPSPFPLNKGADLYNLKLDDYHHEEIARQLCLFDFNLYWKISPYEFLFANKEVSKSIYLTSLLHRYRSLQEWLISNVITLSEGDPEKQKANMILFIGIIRSCLELRNFHSFYGLCLGMNSKEIKEIFPSWDSFSPKVIEKIDEINAAFKGIQDSEGFKNYAKVGVTTVPPIDIFLKEIDVISEKEKDVVELENGDQLINMQKRKNIYSSITEALKYKNLPYNFESVQWLQDYFKEEIDKYSENFEEDLSRSSLVDVLCTNPEKLRKIIKFQLQENKQIRAEISGIFKDLLRSQLETIPDAKPLLSQTKIFKSTIRGDLEHLKATLYGYNDKELLDSFVQESLKSSYPGGEVIEWSEEDKKGMVYGWPEKITIPTIQYDGMNYIVYSIPNIDKAELSMLYRIKTFYEQNASIQDVHAIVFACYAPQSALNIAQSLGFEVVIAQ